MSSHKNLLIIKICLGLLVSCSAARAQSLLLTGPPKGKSMAQRNVKNMKEVGMQQSLIRSDDFNSDRMIGFDYALTPIRFIPFYIPASKQQINLFPTGRKKKISEEFCIERANETINTLRFNAINKQLKY